jgi:3-oxoacyl-[acyl-carrier-protein] synthase III
VSDAPTQNLRKAEAFVADEPQVQFVSDEHGNAVSVIVPMALRREIEAERPQRTLSCVQ